MSRPLQGMIEGGGSRAQWVTGSQGQSIHANIWIDTFKMELQVKHKPNEAILYASFLSEKSNRKGPVVKLLTLSCISTHPTHPYLEGNIDFQGIEKLPPLQMENGVLRYSFEDYRRERDEQ